MIVKICGITNLDDALRSVEYGATALGLNFYPESPRYITPRRAEEIARQLPEEVLVVAVMVVTGGRPTVDGHKSVCDTQWSVVGDSLSALQLHGLRSESQVPSIDKRLFVATSASCAGQFPHQELIIDTSWGSGRKADWEELKKIDRPFILSGGLTAENVSQAIELLHPAGVDVCSGVEHIPGKKDPDKLKRFIGNTRSSLHD